MNIAVVEEHAIDPLPCVIAKLGRLMERRMQWALNPYGISASQFIALSFIAMQPGVSMADLARGIQVTRQAVSGLTGQLAAKSLIVRTEPMPCRSISITITESGRLLLDRAAPVMRDLTYEILQQFMPNLAAVMNRAPRHLLLKLGHRDF